MSEPDEFTLFSEPDEIINDIGTALMNLRRAFMKHDISPPDTLEYSSIDEGYKSAMALRHALGSAKGSANWVMYKPYNNVVLAGFTLRFEKENK